MSNRRGWSEDELKVALALYCRTPFGRIHKSNPSIVQLASKIGRSSNAIAMKMCNFASFDPHLASRKVQGLTHGSKADKEIWDEYDGNWEELAIDSERSLRKLCRCEFEDGQLEDLAGPTEQQRLVKTRLVQRFFRDSVLSSYNYICAFCRLDLPELINASHIIPWSEDQYRRADPCNGLSLCALHDRAFDRGLVTLDEKFRVVLSDRLRRISSSVGQAAFLGLEGTEILLPERFRPDQDALSYHRLNIFVEV